MQLPTYSAHFDGDQIRLDEPVELPRNAALVVMVLPENWNGEEAAWARLAAENLAGAFGNDEPEYSAADVR